MFTNDAYGNVTGNGTNSFTYDDPSNLRCVNCSGGAAVSYDYDADRQREREVSGSVITYYLYARNGNLMYEYSPVDNLSREHVYLGTQRIATVARNDTILDTNNDGM